MLQPRIHGQPPPAQPAFRRELRETERRCGTEDSRGCRLSSRQSEIADAFLSHGGRVRGSRRERAGDAGADRASPRAGVTPNPNPN